MNETQNTQNNQNPFSLTHAFQNALGCAQGLGNTPGTGEGGSARPISDPGFLGHLLNRNAPLPRTTVAEPSAAGPAGTAPPPAGMAPPGAGPTWAENGRKAAQIWREVVNHIQAERGRPEDDPVDKAAMLRMCERAAMAIGWLMNSQTHAAEETVYLLREREDRDRGAGNGQEGSLSPLAALSSLAALNPTPVTSPVTPGTGGPASRTVFPENVNAVLAAQCVGNSLASRPPKEPRYLTQSLYRSMNGHPEIAASMMRSYLISEMGFEDYPLGVMKYLVEVPDVHNLVQRWAEHYRQDGQSCGFAGPQYIRPAAWQLNASELKLIRDLQQLACAEVRPPAVVALAELHEGKVKQGNTETVAQYTQRFMTRVMALPEESPASLCLFYLHGLKPELQKQCILDQNGKRWNRLDLLTQYAYAEEEKLNAVKALSWSWPNRTPAPPQWKARGAQDQQGGDVKRQKTAAGAVATGMDTDEGGSLAAATTSPRKGASANAGRQSGSSGPKAGGGEPSKAYNPPEAPEVYADGPMKGRERGEVRMGMYRHLGLEHLNTIAPGVQELSGKNQYTPFDELPLWKRDLILQYGLCMGCRVGLHKVKDCQEQAIKTLREQKRWHYPASLGPAKH